MRSVRWQLGARRSSDDRTKYEDHASQRTNVRAAPEGKLLHSAIAAQSSCRVRTSHVWSIMDHDALLTSALQLNGSTSQARERVEFYRLSRSCGLRTRARWPADGAQQARESPAWPCAPAPRFSIICGYLITSPSSWFSGDLTRTIGVDVHARSYAHVAVRLCSRHASLDDRRASYGSSRPPRLPRWSCGANDSPPRLLVVHTRPEAQASRHRAKARAGRADDVMVTRREYCLESGRATRVWG